MSDEKTTVRREATPETPLRVLPWSLGCLALCPLVAGALLIGGPGLWDEASSTANGLTVALFDHAAGFKANRNHVAEAIALMLATAFAAALPTLAMAAPRPSFQDGAATFALFYPGWLGVMAAPVAIIHWMSFELAPGVHVTRLAFEFLVAFSAFAAALALAYGLWLRLNPGDAARRRPRIDWDLVRELDDLRAV